MKITTELLSGAMFDTCQTMLGMEILERSKDAPETPPELFASIGISGDFNVAVEVSLCQVAGRSIASAMFDMAPSEVDGEEIADAISEIANIIGGNIKGMFGGECQLSLPSFTNQPKHNLNENSHQVSFDLCGGVMNVLFQPLDTTVQPTTNTKQKI